MMNISFKFWIHMFIYLKASHLDQKRKKEKDNHRGKEKICHDNF